MKLILVIFLSTTYVFHFSTTIRNPIILIPGIGGSQMEIKMDRNAEIREFCKKNSKDFFTIWVNTGYCLTHTPSCMFDALRLIYDEETRQTSNRSGIHTQISGFGYTNTTEYLATTKFVSPYLRKFVKRMVKLGYTRGSSIRAAPYDFRKGPNELTTYFKQLQELIEDTSSKNENKKIVLIAHSLGGLISLIFLQKQTPDWKERYIRFEIALASTWAGTMKAIEAYIRGFGLRGTEFFSKSSFSTSTKSLLKPSYKYIVIPQITLIPKKLVQTLPAVIWLFPSAEAWQKENVLVQIKDKRYTLEDMEEFFEDLHQPNGWKMYNDMKPYVTELKAPGVDLYCFYGTGIRTVASVYSANSFWDAFRYVRHEDGDGMVNLQSLEVCKKWKGETKTVETKAFPGVNHVTILTNSRVFKDIIRLIDGD